MKTLAIDIPANPLTWSLCFAEPDSSSIIDIVHPVTKRSGINQETLEEIRARYPKAELVRFDDWSAAKAAKQDAPVQWLDSTEDRYHEMLNCLPPARWVSGAFLVGEPWDHHCKNGMPRYECHRHVGAKFLVSDRPITVKEFNQIAE